MKKNRKVENVMTIIAINIITLMFIFGVLLPALISAQSTEAVLAGVFILVAMAIAAIYIIGSVVRSAVAKPPTDEKQ